MKKQIFLGYIKQVKHALSSFNCNMSLRYLQQEKLRVGRAVLVLYH